MESVPQPKFLPGKIVKPKGESDTESGVIESFKYHPQTGYSYMVVMRAIDFDAKEIVKGVKHLLENEIEESQVKEIKIPGEENKNES